MSCKINYKGKYYEEKELKEVLSNDPDIIEEFHSSRKVFDTSNYTYEDIGVFNKKIEFLQNSMNVRVVLSSDVESSKVLGSEDPRVKKEGRPIVMVNPDEIFTTTAIHEFGHIFLDSFPKGMDNPRLKKAYEMLKGTELEAEVRELYPELEDDNDGFAKELITTAIGRRGSEIWADRENMSTWESIKSWMLDFIKRKFGFSSKDEIESLTQELLNNRFKKTGMSKKEQFLKAKKESKDNSEKDSKEKDDKKSSIKKLERTYEEMLARIENIRKVYEPQGDVAKKKEEARSMKGKTRYESITELKEAVEELDKVDRRLGISKYIDWVEEEVAVVSSNLDNKIKNKSLSRDSLSGSAEWNKGFDMIDDMQSLITGLYNDNQLTEEETDKYRKDLNRIQGSRSDLESRILEEERRVYVEFMVKNDNQVKTEFIEEFKKDYETLGISSSGLTEGEYVVQQLSSRADEIKEKAEKAAYESARDSFSDINHMEAKFLSEKNSSSKEIQIMSAVATELDQETNSFGNGKASLFDKDNKSYKKENSQINQSEKYSGLYDSTESGGVYLAGNYKAEFYEKRNELKREAFYKEEGESKYKGVKVNEKLEYTVDGVTRKINMSDDATGYKVTVNEKGESFYVSHDLFGERTDTPTALAIAKSEYNYWLQKNVVSEEDANGFINEKPHKDWINKEYQALKGKKKETLEFLKKAVYEADELYKGKGTLTKEIYGEEFIKLPSILKTDIQRIVQGQYASTAKNAVREMFFKEKDDFETQENNNTEFGESFKRVYADISNKERLRVAVPFRSNLKNNEQSLDLHTIVLMNLIAAKNHKLKSEMESTFLIMVDVMANRNTPDKVGIDGALKIHASRKDKDIPIYKNKKDILDAKQARELIESRFYGIKSKDGGKINYGTNEDGTKKFVEVNAVTRTWLKFSGWVALTLNYINGYVNLHAGAIQTYIEAIGGEHFNVKDVFVANKKYFGDIKNIMNDMGSNVDSSRTNLFLNFFNVKGGNHVLSNKFEDGTKLQSAMKMNSLRPISTAGEHMLQAKIMYATLNSIKAMNEKGQFLDKKGNVVKDRKEAASLDEMIEFKPDESNENGIGIVLHPSVKATSHTLTGGPSQVIKEAMNLVKYKVNELQGNHDPDIQAAAQKEFWGKLAYYLRKWMEDGYFRRWRNTSSIFQKTKDVKSFYSQDAKANREGYYVTAIRFMAQVIRPAITQLNIEIIKNGHKELDAFQKANLKKVIGEIGLIALTMAAYLGMDEDEDEIKAKYAFRRALSELTFFMWPPEAIKIISTPTASISTLRSFFGIMSQSLDPFEEFERGPHKGRNKLTVKMLKTTPIVSQYMKDPKSGLDYLRNAGGI